MTSPTIARLFVYPLKSGAGQEVTRWPVGRTGLALDRHLMVVSDSGRFVSLRGAPRLVGVRPRPFTSAATELTFDADSRPDLGPLTVRLDEPAAATLEVEIWGEWVPGETVSAKADAWFSALLEEPHRLVRLAAQTPRQVDPRYAQPGDVVGFADGFSILLTATASHDEVVRSVAARRPDLTLPPFDVQRFRPNIVVATDTPWVEDSWQRLEVGGIPMELVKPCARCVAVNVDPVTARTSREPLATLALTRTREGKVFFGHNVIHRGVGELAVGAPVFIEPS